MEPQVPAFGGPQVEGAVRYRQHMCVPNSPHAVTVFVFTYCICAVLSSFFIVCGYRYCFKRHSSVALLCHNFEENTIEKMKKKQHQNWEIGHSYRTHFSRNFKWKKIGNLRNSSELRHCPLKRDLFSRNIKGKQYRKILKTHLNREKLVCRCLSGSLRYRNIAQIPNFRCLVHTKSATTDYDISS